jgi:hypothetical protein
MIELGPDAIEHRISEARSMLSFAESLTLIPAEAPGEIKAEAKQLFDDLDPAYLDTILAAHGNDRILLCDDLPFRLLAAETAPIRTVWTQPAVAFGVSLGLLSVHDHFRVSNVLAESGYFYTTINNGNFLHALKQSRWSIDTTARALADLLARPTNVADRVLLVLSDLMWSGWVVSPNSETFKNLFAAIFSSFMKAQPNLGIEALADAAFSRAQRTIRRNIVLARLRGQLLQSTYLTPVASVIAELEDLPQKTIRLIAQLLTEALRLAKAE